jgi:hypothetical protein
MGPSSVVADLSSKRKTYHPRDDAKVYRQEFPPSLGVSDGDFWISNSNEHYLRWNTVWLPFLGLPSGGGWILIYSPVPPDGIDHSRILWYHHSGILHRQDPKTREWIPCKARPSDVVAEYVSLEEFFAMNPQYRLIRKTPAPDFKELPDAYGGF